MITLLILLACLSLVFYLFMQQPTFGIQPKGARRERILKSPNYSQGSFQNLHNTPMMAPDASYWKMMKSAFFSKPEDASPSMPLPSVKTDLKALAGELPTIVWFGHSSYLIKTNGKTFLIDPVMSGKASPVSFFGKSYPGSDVYQVDDLPSLDGLILTHDHYDHLDYETLLRLKGKTKHFYTALGVGAHLAHWGVPEAVISEFDWWEGLDIGEGIRLTAVPARHFSGRSFKRYQSLWVSFILKTPSHNLFLGGDSGYDDHFKAIGEKFGPFDIALLECGQYNSQWPLIHMMPEQTVQASIDLKAKVLMPVHWAKFTLSLHSWTESVERASKAAHESGVKITTPRIGEPVVLDQSYPQDVWWR